MKKNFAIGIAALGLLLFSAANLSAQCIPPADFYWGTMWGGQSMYVGEYTVDSRSGTDLTIEVWGVDDWRLKEVHIAVVTDPADFPLNKGGNLKLNEFPWKMSYTPPTTGTFSITIPFDDFDPYLWNGQPVYIMIHATFQVLASGEVIQDETAFNGPCGKDYPWGTTWPSCWAKQLGTARWAYYIKFIL